MAIGYVVHCRCSHTVVVGASQAGQTVACQQCGSALDIPTLLELRRLERVDVQESRQRSGGWAVWRLLLLIGGLLAVVGSAASLYLLQTWPAQPTDLFSAERLEKDTLGLSPVESLKAWYDILRGVDASRKSLLDRAVYNQRVMRQRHSLWAGLIVAGVGLLIGGVALGLRGAGARGQGSVVGGQRTV